MVIHAGWRWTTTSGLQKTIPENEVGNEARILLDDEVGAGVRRFSLPDRRLCARTPFYCKTRSHSPFEFLSLPIVTEDAGGSEIPAVLGPARDIENAALEELIRLEEDVGDELLCSATVETDQFAAKQAVLQFQKMKTLPDDPPGVRWCAPREEVRVDECGGAVCAEEVLREMRVREGRDAHHGDMLTKAERRMLDENFFLYNDVPDTGAGRRASIRGLSAVVAAFGPKPGSHAARSEERRHEDSRVDVHAGMWRQSDFRRAIQQQGCCLCEDKRKRLPRFFRETTKNPGLEDNKHALVQTTYRSQRPAVPRRLHAIEATRVHQTRSWVVSSSNLSCFGPRRGRRGVSEGPLS
jgi:hypothetical protein